MSVREKHLQLFGFVNIFTLFLKKKNNMLFVFDFLITNLRSWRNSSKWETRSFPLVFHFFFKKITHFQVLFGITFFYCIAEIHIFSFALFPYSTSLAANAKKLLTEALPHNPLGVDPIEHQLRCTFDVRAEPQFRRVCHHNSHYQCC